MKNTARYMNVGLLFISILWGYSSPTVNHQNSVALPDTTTQLISREAQLELEWGLESELPFRQITRPERNGLLLYQCQYDTWAIDWKRGYGNCLKLQAWQLDGGHKYRFRVKVHFTDSVGKYDSTLIDTTLDAMYLDPSREDFISMKPVILADVNFDGNSDILFLKSAHGHPLRWTQYYLWLWDSHLQDFRYYPGFDTLNNPGLNVEKKILVDRFFHGQMSNSITGYTRYTWQSKKLIPDIKIQQDLVTEGPNDTGILPLIVEASRYDRTTNSWMLISEENKSARYVNGRFIMSSDHFERFCPSCQAATGVQFWDYNLLEHR